MELAKGRRLIRQEFRERGRTVVGDGECLHCAPTTPFSSAAEKSDQRTNQKVGHVASSGRRLWLALFVSCWGRRRVGRRSAQMCTLRNMGWLQCLCDSHSGLSFNVSTLTRIGLVWFGRPTGEISYGLSGPAIYYLYSRLVCSTRTSLMGCVNRPFAGPASESYFPLLDRTWCPERRKLSALALY